MKSQTGDILYFYPLGRYDHSSNTGSMLRDQREFDVSPASYYNRFSRDDQPKASTSKIPSSKPSNPFTSYPQDRGDQVRDDDLIQLPNRTIPRIVEP